MRLGRECTSKDCQFSEEGREYLPDDANFTASSGSGLEITVNPAAPYRIVRGVQDSPENFKVEIALGLEPQISYKKCSRHDCGLRGDINSNLEVLALAGVEIERKIDN